MTTSADTMKEELPKLRGLLHAYAVAVAAVAGVVLVLLADGGRARLASGIYALALVALFTASSLYHRWPDRRRGKAVLRRIDHSTIFVFIAASYTPIALLTIDGTLATVVLISVWAGAAAGTALSVGWIDAPRALQAACYLALGWVAIITLPELLDELGLVPTLLFGAGGALYSIGAVVYARQRPDPWPRVFGYHEVFHTLVILAAAVHFVAMVGWVVPGADG